MKPKELYRQSMIVIFLGFISLNVTATEGEKALNNGLLLINQVTFIDHDGEKSSTVANILIKNGLLELISQDDLASDSMTETLNAN
jgi:hypothetical protein